jgi:hypothetical protein
MSIISIACKMDITWLILQELFNVKSLNNLNQK